MGYSLFFLVYIVLVLAASLLVRKKVRSMEDFFLASRKLPGLLIFVSLTASWIGATSTLVSVDEAYLQGISAFWVMGMPAVLTLLVFAFFLAGPIRRLPGVSLPDLVERAYGRTVRHAAALLIIWYMILLAVSQMVALGSFLKLFLGWPYFTCLLLGTAAVLVYAVLGGYFSVTVTDGLQLFFLFAGILGLLVFLLKGAAFHEIILAVSQTGKEGYFHFFAGFPKNVLIAFSFTLAWIISPVVWQRIQSSKTEQAAKNALFVSAGVLTGLFWALVAIGIMSLTLFPGGKEEGPLLSSLILNKTGTLLGGFLFVAVVAAIMSTMDTALNTGALSMTRDFLQQIHFIRKRANSLFLSRASTVFLGLCAFGIALRFQSILKTLGLASEIMAEGFFIPGIAMLYLKKKRPLAGFLGLGLGGGFAICGFLVEAGVLPLKWPPWPYSLPYGIGLSALGFAAGCILEKKFIKDK